MSAQADALMAIFGYKRVGNDDSQGSAEGATSGIRESDATGEAGEVDADLRRQPGRNNRAKSNAGSRSVSIKPARLKKCAQCRCEFQPQRMGQKACSPSCAAEIAKKKREKVEKANDRQKRESMKTITQWANETQSEFNALRREEDLAAGYGCISCGTHKAKQWHAGHYRNVKTHKSLRFSPYNVHLQCSQCNCDEGGNKIEYRINLVKRIGVEMVEALEADNDIKKWTVEELKALRKEFKAQRKELADGR